MFTKETIILDIISDYPQTQEVFSSYDDFVGKCVMCNHMFESLENFALQYNIDLEKLISKLNEKII